MSYGLRLYNTAGDLELDVSDRLTRFHSIISVPALGAGGSLFIPISGMSTDGTWFLSLSKVIRNVIIQIVSGGIQVSTNGFATLSFNVLVFRG